MASSFVRESECLTFDEITIQDLKSSIRGEVIQRDDASYQKECKKYRSIAAGSPWMIIKCHGMADVSEAVRFGTIHRLRISIHDSRRQATACDDGLVIDLMQVPELQRTDGNNAASYDHDFLAANYSIII